MRRRRVHALLCVGCALAWGSPTEAEQDPDAIVWGCDDAGYALPTTEYPHGVLGDDVEYKSLVLLVHTDAGVIPATFELPPGQVYEDTAPRCADLDGDGEDEVITVVSDADQGARLVVYSKRAGPLAETPPIGQGFRWLAPAGVADFDGDGRNDIAYVETPHLAGVLRVLTLQDGRLAELASAAGFSNHRIGESVITGGVRDCGDGPELVLPDLDWSRLMAVRLNGGRLDARPIASAAEPDTIAKALACDTE